MRTVLGRAQNKQESKCACLPDSGRQETGEREGGRCNWDNWVHLS